VTVDRPVPPFGLVGAVHERIDAMGEWTSTARDHAGSRVWRVDWADRAVFVKQHHQARKRRQEVFALREWTPRLVAANHRVPVLIADLPRFDAVVMTAVAGDEADKRPPGDVAGLWRAAGRVLRALHDLPFTDTDPVGLPEAIVARTEAWCARAEGLVSATTVGAVRQRIGRGEAFVGARRVPCHRDYQPRNWLVAGGTGPGVVDWEHATPDAREADLVRVAAQWAEEPPLRDAFLAGYGPLDPAATDRLHRLVPLFGLATLVWALEHGDAAFEASGRAILTRAL